MKHVFIVSLALMVACLYSTFGFALNLQHVEPAFWYVGMKNPTLQIMLHGSDVASADISIDYPGVTLTEVAHTSNPNYAFIYLQIHPDATPGMMKIHLRNGRKTTTLDFELRARNTKIGAQGFSAADVLYLIMPDRFANGDASNDEADGFGVDRSNGGGRHGGDFQGIMRHLDYIDQLGVTAIWLNPVQYNKGRASHGYSITDYYSVDPRFGGNEAYCNFIDATHDRGMKVVMDMIFNHCGSSHWWLQDVPDDDWFNQNDCAVTLGNWQREAEAAEKETKKAAKKGKQAETPQRRWRSIPGLQNTTHYKWVLMDPHAPQSEKDLLVDGWFVAGMPDLNQRNRHLANYLIQNCIWWIEYARIDGVRMDTYPYADYDFMVRWCREVNDEYPDFNIVGEGWYPRNSAAGWWQTKSALNDNDTRLKTVMDFDLAFTMQREILNESNVSEGYEAGLFKVYECITQDFLIPDPQHVLTFLDNHDINRYMQQGDPIWKLKQGLAFLLTTRGIPQIYYGTEWGLEGDAALHNGRDYRMRIDMPGGWEEDTVSVFTPEGRTARQNEAYDFASKLLQWRRHSRAVAEGRLLHYTPDNLTHCYVYARVVEGETVLVVLNGSDREQTVPMARFSEVTAGFTCGKDVLTEELMDITSNLTISPRGVLILELK
ncbi:MAG: alpha-amylase family glycosyl hydrolase [Paludibacteraceae bacterium]|nr:alpha-amylase family glycosyl hydrolase [Paludibacteraceae bacterium]